MRKLLMAGCLAFAFSANAADGNPVTYEIAGQPYEGYYVESGQPESPFILLIHDWNGLTDYEVKRSNMLAEEGYDVFAIDLFGKGVRPTEVADKRQHTGELYKNREKMRALMTGAIEQARLKGADINNAVAMGYCFGGAAVLELARSGENLKGFATFHGGLKTPDGQDYGQIKGEILVLHGTADKNIPMSQFADLANELESDGVENEMISYGGADHAFTVFDDKRYHPEADKASWARFKSFAASLLQP